jgi:ankyrin repeat protein
MKQIRWILVDAVILFLVSTVCVLLANWIFSGMKSKNSKHNPLIAAISRNDLKELEVIALSNEDFIYQSDDHGRTPLMHVAYVNYSNKLLLAEADEKRAAMATLLLNNRALINQQDHDGWTALMWSAWSNMPRVVGELIDRGAIDTLADKQGNSALIIAARRGNAEIVRLLINRDKEQSTTASFAKNALAQAEIGMGEYPDKVEQYQTIILMLRM